MSKSKLLSWLGSAVMVVGLVGCGVNPTLAPTATAAATSTPAPTATIAPTPTPKFGIDMEKFTNFPQSHAYLLNHLGEFVQAPDPVTDRAAFGRWFNEELVPAFGPIDEREINIYPGDLQSGRYSFRFFNRGGEINGQLHSFYFINSDVVYFVPCINVEQDAANPNLRKGTFCVALFDNPVISFGNRAIELLYQNKYFRFGEIVYDLSANNPGIEWGNMDAIVRSVGDYNAPGTGNIKFGFGELYTYPKPK